MAYYQKAPNQPRKPRREEAWEEEGTRYSDRRGGKPAREGGRPARDARPARSGFGPRTAQPEWESRGGKRDGAPRGDRRPGFGDRRPAQGERRFGPQDRKPERGFAPRGERRDRFEDRPREPKREYAPRRAPQEEKPSYLDYEFGQTPIFEDAQAEPRENLLVGRNPIREALKSGRDLEKLMVQRGELSGSARQLVQMAREARVPVQEVEKSRLDEIAPNHQGMIAFASAYAYAELSELFEVAQARGEDPFFVILDGVTDPHNLGAIIRSAECAGAHGVIVRERRGVGLTPAAVKASAGAIEHVKVARVTNLNRVLEEMKKRGVWVYALAMDGDDYEQVDFTGGVALVVGSEGSGISRLTEENCDRKVSLPMKGQLDSLNASVAAGIVMYRVLSSRRA